IGNPVSPAGRGDAADASWTGICAAGNSPTTAGGAITLPSGNPAPTNAVGADSTAPSALAASDRLAAEAPSAFSPSDRPSPISGATACNAWAEVNCAKRLSMLIGKPDEMNWLA